MTECSRKSGIWLLLLLVVTTLCSGAAALVFETLWTRAFSLILGSTVQAASAVFAAFLTALALGAYLGGRWTAGMRRPVLAYCGLELAIAVVATVVGLILHRQASVLAGYLRGPLEWNRALAAYASALVLVFPPTFLMGMTFPWIVTLARRFGGATMAVTLVYGANTLGAALGTLLCGFFLIRWVGVEHSLFLGGALNLVSGVLVLGLLKRAESSVAPSPVESVEAEPAERETVSQAPSEGVLLLAAMLSGFVTLGLEIVWFRYASYFVGNRTYAFSALLASVLVLLAFGSWIAGWLRKRPIAPSALLGSVFLVAFVGTSVSIWGVNYWIGRQDEVELLLPGASEYLMVYRVVQAVASLALVLLPLGVLFPLSLTLSRRSATSLGKTSGHYYFVNTVGAVTGSVLTGFFGMSYLGANAWGRLLALVCFVAALAFFLLELRHGQRRLGRWGLGVVFVAGGLLLVPQMPLQYVRSGERLSFRAEDEYGVFQVAHLPGGERYRVSNNKTDLVFLLGSPETDYVQQMQAHLGMFFAPWAKKVAVLGSGYGITAGGFSAHPDLERIDAVEILPIMVLVTASEEFARHNLRYFDDPRVRIAVDDGRHFLTRSDETYDVISVNVSDPRLPGGSALFHREFYEVAKSRLHPNGIVLQHIFGPESSTALATLMESFPHVRLFPAYGNGFNAVASLQSLTVDVEALSQLAQAPSVAAALEGIGILEPLSLFQVLEAGIDPKDRPDLHRPGLPVATDDAPLIEFAWSENAIENLRSND